VLITALAGLGFGLSLIVAIGAQNAFVLRQGLRREHVLAAVLVCALSDAVLILLGIAGAGAVIEAVPVVLAVVRYAGAAFLLVYGLLAARRALRPAALTADGPAVRASLAATLGTTLALTWLNPHVYLDTLLLIGSISTRFPGQEPAFAAGAMSASVAFFFSLGYGAAILRPLFAKPAAWRVLEGVIAITMWVIAAELLLSGR